MEMDGCCTHKQEDDAYVFLSCALGYVGRQRSFALDGSSTYTVTTEPRGDVRVFPGCRILRPTHPCLRKVSTDIDLLGSSQVQISLLVSGMALTNVQVD